MTLVRVKIPVGTGTCVVWGLLFLSDSSKASLKSCSDKGIPDYNNGHTHSLASFHETARKMQHTERSGPTLPHTWGLLQSVTQAWRYRFAACLQNPLCQACGHYASQRPIHAHFACFLRVWFIKITSGRMILTGQDVIMKF